MLQRLFSCASHLKIQSRTIPPLFKNQGIGLADIAIEEADLYKYQRYRWLSGEAEKLAARYREFNLTALLDVAGKATGVNGAQCIKIVKCLEGQFNKALILTMSTGQEIVARIPNPNAGSGFYTVASEVATRHFLRDYLDMPIPHVLAWSADDSNPVGAEYILEEKADGVPLGEIWRNISFRSRLEVTNQLIDLEERLASLPLPGHGCIYYTSDLESRSVHPVFPLSQHTGFVLGPLTNPCLWHGQRAKMELNRGPWKSIAEYATAIGENEIKWARLYAEPRPNSLQSSEQLQTRDDYVSLLNHYLSVAPVLIQQEGGERTITHPDLHMDNIFINPDTERITSIIDWQHASVSPLILQPSVPQMVELSPQSPQLDNETIYDEKAVLDFYEESVKNNANLLLRTFHTLETGLFPLVPSCWDRNDLYSLRHALIALAARWGDVVGVETPCPLSFTEQELLQHQDEMDVIQSIRELVRLLENGGIPIGGMVPREEYETARQKNLKYKQRFLDVAKDEEQREFFARIWPY